MELKISLVTPCLNQVETLESTIQSILCQNFPQLEYIIMDGGSRDGRKELIERYAGSLHYWTSGPDKGNYDAINAGFSHSTGDIMGWLNADDMLCPWALRTIADVFANLPEVDWISSLRPLNWDSQGNCVDCRIIPGFSKRAFLEGFNLPGFDGDHSGHFIQQESTFWRRRLWEASGPLRPEAGLAADFELWSRFFEVSPNLYGITVPLGGFRYREQQLSYLFGERYMQESAKALESARIRAGWKPTLTRRWARHLGFGKVPVLRRLTGCLFQGKKIYRINPRSSEAKWGVRDTLFLAD